MRLVDAHEYVKELKDEMDWPGRHPEFISAIECAMADLSDMPTIDAVSRGLYDQIKWERDIAIGQLDSYGISLGEKADVAKVRHARWTVETDEEEPNPMFKLVVCSGCNRMANYIYNYCPHCGATMDLESEGRDE